MKKVKILKIIALVSVIGFGIFKIVDLQIVALDLEKIFERERRDSDGTLIVGWNLLYKLNYETGHVPKEVKDIDGKFVKVPGYIVPLSDNYSILNEFLLVPDAQACIHVPPPPPNLIVFVKLKKSIPMRKVVNPAWVRGVLKVQTTTSQFGQASYSMDAEGIEKFVWKKRK